jgi:hypothetical protein
LRSAFIRCASASCRRYCARARPTSAWAAWASAAACFLLVDLAHLLVGADHLGLDLRHTHLLVGRVQFHQQVAGAHLLVVGNQHLVHGARNARGNWTDVRGEVGVVGLLDVMAAPRHAARHAQQGQQHGQQDQAALAALSIGGRGSRQRGRLGLVGHRMAAW